MEEQARSSQEMVLKNEVMKINEAFAREYDFFKNAQTSATE